MAQKILLTSFQTWLPHQHSNASDDLLEQLQKQAVSPDSYSLVFLRQLPVDTALASKKAIASIKLEKPDVIICCGMAESRQQLTIESGAWGEEKRLKTTVDLAQLIHALDQTKISHDAGKFVCEGLYYQVLNYLQKRDSTRCIFVHVPPIDSKNLSAFLSDFAKIFDYFCQHSACELNKSENLTEIE